MLLLPILLAGTARAARAVVPGAGTFGPGERRPVSPEYELKAAFLYKFVMFTEWPKEAFADAKAPIIVQVVGQDPFAGRLTATFRGKKLRGRSFVVRHSATVPKQIDAHVLFAGGMTDRARATLLRRTWGRPVLLVGDEPGFAKAGALVNMYLVKGKVRFEINPGAAKTAGLRISSQLLKLARIVQTDSEEEGR